MHISTLYIYVCVYVCVYVCMYVCMQIYTCMMVQVANRTHTTNLVMFSLTNVYVKITQINVLLEFQLTYNYILINHSYFNVQYYYCSVFYLAASVASSPLAYYLSSLALLNACLSFPSLLTKPEPNTLKILPIISFSISKN